MDYENYLKNEQPIAYKIFYNSIKENRLFHAYLLSGETGTPLLEMATFLAESILCDHPNPFACGKCNTCHRVKENNYGDFIVVDGRKETIKKEKIQYIETEFSKTSLETKGKKVYVINLIENMNEDSINALLKFLEEPSDNTYAIFTTENEFRVLPTILSRTQIIHFNLLDRKKLILDTVSIGVKEDDAQILSNFYNDPNTIKAESQDSDYITAKELALKFFDQIKNKNEIRFFIQNQICPIINTKQSLRFFLDIMIFFFKESYTYKIEKHTILSSYVKILVLVNEHVSNLDSAILLLMDSRNEINYNLNTSLLTLHTLTKIFEV